MDVLPPSPKLRYRVFDVVKDFQLGHCGLCQREPTVPGFSEKHTATQPVTPEMRLGSLNVCLTSRRLNQLS